VTQPTIFARHGAAFLRETAPRDHASLWRYASLLRAGIRVAASSDAPYGDPDPARTIAAAVNRPIEGVDARTVLDSLLSAPESPGGPPRRVELGADADLCLLSTRLEDALADAVTGVPWPVRATFVSGVPVHLAG
jgi:predicted amidohydrolase YtcJ